MDLYREEILDHYKHPHNFGHLDSPDSTEDAHNISCGDKISMEVVYKGKGKTRTISDIRFSGGGCAISMATASMLTDWSMDKPIDAVMQLGIDDVQEWLGTTLTPARVKCALLSVEVLQKAIRK
jgi:nitrogen fixation NifU-like protein